MILKRYKLGVLLLVLVSSLIFGAIPIFERAALIALYNSPNGDNWTNSSAWKTAPFDADGFAKPGTEGDWFGVTVENDHVIVPYYVQTIIGNIPKELSKLKTLNCLILFKNQFSKIIAPELGNMFSLRHFDLHDNVYKKI